MCFELDSVPPIPALSGAALSPEDLVLSSADGHRFAPAERTAAAALQQALRLCSGA